MLELDSFLIADGAYGSPEGKIYIHGGGITRLNPLWVPWLQPQLAFMIRLKAEPEDFGEHHVVTIAFIDPAGEEGERSTIAHEFGPIGPPEAIEGEDLFLQLFLTISPIPFNRAGLYHVAVRVDGDELRRDPFPINPQMAHPDELPEADSNGSE
jgi:hypothetical protein